MMSPGPPSPASSCLRMSFIAALLAGGAGVGQQRHLAGVLDRGSDVALVLAAVAGHPTSADLAAVGDELAQQAGVLVVHVVDLLFAEDADLLLDLANWCGLGHDWYSESCTAR